MRIEKPIASFCASFIVLSASIVLAINVSGLSFADDLSAFSVKIKHYGVHAKEIEKTIAIPLEDELYGINNVKNILTVSENGSATAYITFKAKNKKSLDGRYEAISAAAQRVYESLPGSAQKPEIAMATENRRPVWTAAITSKKENEDISSIIEGNIKPALKSVQGVAEVEVSGSGINEIIIALNGEHTAVAGFTPDQMASVLSQTDLMLPSGIVQEGDREILVMVDGRYKEVDDLKNLPILGADGKTILLGEIASITKREREPDTLSRLNGKKTIVLSVYPAYNAPLGKLSNLIKQRLGEFQKHPVVIDVLSDTGEEEARAFRSVLLATLQGMFAVALISALLIRGNSRNRLITVICTMVVPYICILSACILVMLGFEFNKILLAGLSSGLGAAVDTTILCCEYLGACASVAEIKAKLKSIRIPLISGSLTTIIALTPIMFSEFATNEIVTIAYSIACVNFVSLFLSLSILPPFFSLTVKNKNMKLRKIAANTDKKDRNESSFLKYANKFKRRAIRIFGLSFNFSIQKPKIIFASAILITAAGIITVLVCGTDTEANENEKTVFGQIEFKGGIRAEVVDKSLELWAQKIKEINGINSVQCSSHVDSSVVLVSFSPKLITGEQVRTILKNQKIQGGFLYIPENSRRERIWSITVSGESTERCKEAARLLAQRCSAIPIVQETVLNFKDGSKNISFIPERNRITSLNSTSKSGEAQGAKNIFNTFANVLRWNVHGPVAYKRLEQNGSIGASSLNEVDVRIRGLGSETTERSELFNSVMSTGGGKIISVNSVMRNKEGVEESSIRRLGRRRVASISVRTAAADARKIKGIIMEQLEKIELPSGYSIEFDRDAIEASESLAKTGFYFMLAILFCYMIIAAANESFIIPLIVMSVVPVSASLSAIALQAAGFRFNAASSCALLSVCGIAVNSSVVVVDNILEKIKSEYSRLGFYKAVRERFSVLFATTGTTILATLPFIFLQENSNTMIRSLSLVTASGVFVSLLCSLFLVPTIFYTANRKGVLRSGTKHLV